jgi:hypothetical protein
LFVCQIYVDDIIFGSTNKSTCEEFSRIMVQKFEMSMMWDLRYFLGFQIKQLQEGTFISQTKYIQDILKKFGMKDVKHIKTPMGTNGHLDLDMGGKSVDQKVYRSMIGSLLYLCASRPDIMLFVCMCARFQANPKEVHLRAVKRIMRYLAYTPKFGLLKCPKPLGLKCDTITSPRRLVNTFIHQIVSNLLKRDKPIKVAINFKSWSTTQDITLEWG